MSGYLIECEGRAIHCLTCGRVSHNKNDVKHRYCAHCHKYHEDANENLEMWAVFAYPNDHPDGFVARLFVVRAGMVEGTMNAYFGATLDEVRGFLTRHYPGLVPIKRSDHDDPHILETWL